MKTSCNGLNWTRYKVNFTVETLANVRVYLSLLANVSITKPILLLLPGWKVVQRTPMCNP